MINHICPDKKYKKKKIKFNKVNELHKNRTKNLYKLNKFLNQFNTPILMTYLIKDIQMIYLVAIFHENHTKTLACVP